MLMSANVPNTKNYLTDFMPMFLLYTSSKHQKTRGFLIFSGDIGNIDLKWFDFNIAKLETKDSEANFYLKII